MKYQSLNGREYTINTTKYLKKPTNKSKLHLRIREFLKSFLNGTVVLEEVPIKTGKTTLYLDFFIPSLCISIEGQGEQHFRRITHFHSQSDFLKAQHNDRMKRQICELNGWILLEFSYDSTESDWKTLLNS